MKKKIILPIIAISLIGLGVFGVSQARAASSSSNPVSSLVDMIASKFNLDKTQVQGVFDQFHSQQLQKRQDNLNSRLDQAVKDGKITSTQKQAILDELAKLKTEYPLTSFKGLTKQQRLDTFNKEQAEIKAWASSQGIDLTKLKGLMGFPRFPFLRHMDR